MKALAPWVRAAVFTAASRGRGLRIHARVNKSNVRETLCFAGIFLVMYFATNLLFEHVSLRDGVPASRGWDSAVELSLQSVIATLLAAPAYYVLMSWYRRFESRRRGSAAGDEK